MDLNCCLQDAPVTTTVVGNITLTDIDLGTNAALNSLTIVCDNAVGWSPVSCNVPYF
jgi:hypothetical protein